jgi:branched-chain amino acid transport system substrate-binding protein
MKIRNIVLASAMVAAAAGAFAQAKEQFFPGLPYRTGPYAPNGVPWANGYADYMALTNARGGINGVKIIYEECETGYDTARGVECYERLKGKHGGATVFQPLSTGITFALTEKIPATRFR